jgi:predicted nucleic acid-binding protein
MPSATCPLVISFDTNILVHASNLDSAENTAARDFLESLAEREDVVVCELMLVGTRSAKKTAKDRQRTD